VRRDLVDPAALADVARALARALAAGLPLAAACVRAADALPPAPADALRRSGRLLANGATPEEAFAWMGAVEGGQLLEGAIAIHTELGGDLVATLTMAARALAERERLRGEVEVATAPARFAARVVPVVPAGALLIAAALDPAAVRPLLTTRPGAAVLFVALALDLIGALVLRRMAAGVGGGGNRDQVLARELPDVVDLMAAAVGGGTPVDRALMLVQRYAPEALGSAFVRASRASEQASVILRREAAALAPLAALLAASEELGAPLAEPLRQLAGDLRERRGREVRLRAAAAGPRMMLVVAGLLAPAALLLVVGTELLSVVEALRGVRG
jgi:Flp pilus assembly protein TadB